MSDDLRLLACIAQHGAHFFPAPLVKKCQWCQASYMDVKESSCEPFVSDFDREGRFGRWVRSKAGDEPRLVHLPSRADLNVLPEWVRE